MRRLITCCFIQSQPHWIHYKPRTYYSNMHCDCHSFVSLQRIICTDCSRQQLNHCHTHFTKTLHNGGEEKRSRCSNSAISTFLSCPKIQLNPHYTCYKSPKPPVEICSRNIIMCCQIFHMWDVGRTKKDFENHLH